MKLILPNQKELLIESRSSKLYNINKIPDQPIIGKYSNNHKIYEKENDLFFKSLFYIRNKNLSLIENLKVKNSFIVTGCCTLQDFKDYGYIGNLGQTNTSYNLLKITPEHQIVNFKEKLLETLKNNSKILQKTSKPKI